jgi:hypothetical protein
MTRIVAAMRAARALERRTLIVGGSFGGIKPCACRPGV